MKKRHSKQGKVVKGCLFIIGAVFIIALILPALVDTGETETTAETQASVKPDPPKETNSRKAVAKVPPTETVKKEAPEAKPEPPPSPPLKEDDWKGQFEALKAAYLGGFKPPEIGSPINLVLANGAKQSGTLRELSEDQVTIAKGAGTAGFNRNDLSKPSRSILFAEDFAAYKAYAEVKAKKDAHEEAEKAKADAELAKEQIPRDFEKWALENTAVIDIHIEGPSMFVTLKPEKYTNKDNVRVIAEQLAEWYGRRSGRTYVACRVYYGKKVYAKGSYTR